MLVAVLPSTLSAAVLFLPETGSINSATAFDLLEKDGAVVKSAVSRVKDSPSPKNTVLAWIEKHEKIPVAINSTANFIFKTFICFSFYIFILSAA